MAAAPPRCAVAVDRQGGHDRRAAAIYSTFRLTIVLKSGILNHMVDNSTPQLDFVFHALADPTRRAMLVALASHDKTVGELARPFSMSLAAASKHVKVLERAGLVCRTVKGRTHTCRLDPAPLRTADEWLRFYEGFWTGRLDALEAALKAEESSPSNKDK